MKKSLCLLGILALGAAMITSAQAQAPVYAPQTLAGSNSVTRFTIAASTATNMGILVDCRKQNTVAIQVVSTNTAAGVGAGAGSIAFRYTRSVDGLTFNNALEFADCPASPNGVSTFSWSTNLQSQGAGYIYIPYFTNKMESGTNVGTIVVNQAIKIGAP